MVGAGGGGNGGDENGGDDPPTEFEARHLRTHVEKDALRRRHIDSRLRRIERRLKTELGGVRRILWFIGTLLITAAMTNAGLNLLTVLRTLRD